jgi:hypothetical protein
MADDKNSFPRVIITKGQEEGGIWVNFKPSSGLSAAGDEKTEVLNQILQLADDWTSYCISSLEFLPSMSHFGFFMVEQSIDEDTFLFLKDISISNEEMFDEEQKRTTFSFIFHEEDLREVAAKLATTTQMMRAAHAMKRSVLGSLIAELDFFMSRFLALAAKLEPERFYDVNESVPLGKIVSAGSVNDYIESRIKSAVRDKLRDSHVDQIDWVVTTFGLAQDISKYRKSKIFREFVEVCQRRHVLTHNGGERRIHQKVP